MSNSDPTLTLKQAYEAMYLFVERWYYETGQPKQIGTLLDEMMVDDDGETGDPGSWGDFEAIGLKIGAGNEWATFEEMNEMWHKLKMDKKAYDSVRKQQVLGER